jgi:hypothetical protein
MGLGESAALNRLVNRAPWAIGVAAASVVAAACATSSPTLLPSTSPSANPGAMPSGQPISIDIDIGVELSADNRTVTLRFVGGPILPANNPCRTEYAGWARPAGEVLEVAVVLLPTPLPAGQTSPVACSAIGAARSVQVDLGEPFLGTLAHDVSFGTTIPIKRPEN